MSDRIEQFSLASTDRRVRELIRRNAAECRRLADRLDSIAAGEPTANVLHHHTHRV